MASLPEMGTPIVFERATSSSKRKKPRLGELDRAERQFFKAADRSTKAASRGMQSYDKARKKSARRERDGAIIDVIPNIARGGAVTAAKLAPVPLDLLRAGFTPSVRKASRRTVRAAARMFDGS
jgi:hypothetical protein